MVNDFIKIKIRNLSDILQARKSLAILKIDFFEKILKRNL